MSDITSSRVFGTRAKIVRALMCAVGEHEPWVRENVWNGAKEVVYLDVLSRMHADVHCCVCKHCRVVYVRKREEGKENTNG